MEAGTASARFHALTGAGPAAARPGGSIRLFAACLPERRRRPRWNTSSSNISILTAAPVLNLGLLIDGVLIGSIFALAAYGLALVWGVMNVKNLAQGDFIMLGGYITWSLGRHGVDPLLGVLVAFVMLWGIGWVIYRLVVSKVITRDLFTSLLATFGIAIVIQQSLNLAFGPDTQSAQAGLPTWQLAGGLVTIPVTRVIGFALAACWRWR